MNDFDKATAMIGNRFNMVLVASERMRELHKQRKDLEDHGDLSVETRRKEPPPHIVAINDIEEGRVGKEYLQKLKDRRKRRSKFDHLK